MHARSFLMGVLPFALAGVGLGQNHSLRFFGGGVNAPDADRVKIRIDEPADSNPGPPVDVGAEDFTIELFVKGQVADNTAAAIACGTTNAWIFGNIVLDRDRFNQGRNYGVSFGAGRVAFGVMNEAGIARTLCGTSNVLDGTWHHLALQRRRSDGFLWIFVDGVLEAQSDGPDGDISYPDDGVPGGFCGGPCTNSDPFIVIGAEKHDAGARFPSFNGFVDELRYSRSLRYSGAFTPPSQPFAPDSDTVALYHFDEGSGPTLSDSSGATGGPSDGQVNYGGNPLGPMWSTDTPFAGGCEVQAFGTGKPTSTGSVPQISTTGTPSVAANDFSLELSGAVAGQPGIFFCGDGANAAPFMGGTLYVLPPIDRLPPFTIDGGGVASQAFAADAGLVGLERFFQAWFRDPTHPDGFGVGLSNGLSVTFCR